MSATLLHFGVVCKVPVKDLTTTSYALLVHLALRPWSAFELAKQMRRGLDLIWPRAESALYEEPKNLVAHGLARARKEPTGRRFRTVYAITPKGRRALAQWLASASPAPRLESEPMIRVFFAEQGSKADLVATIDRMERFGEEVRARLLAQIEGYLAAGGPFAERWHVIGLGSRYLLDYAELNERWARWARAEVSGWSGDLSDAGPGPELLRDNIAAHRPEQPPDRAGQSGARPQG